eukprot:SM000101S09267  [mRNA]  locus=s101:244995:249777:- [translate_table: standard]
MAPALATVLALLLAAAASEAAPAHCPAGAGEGFTEELLLRPLPGAVLARFHFASWHAGTSRRHHLHTFPKALDQLVDATWRNLTHALSGLLCASLNLLGDPAAAAAPSLSFRPDGGGGSWQQGSPVRYGTLPREPVCTENLTPWLKLLPCRDKVGLATLLNRTALYSAAYHSLRIHIRAQQPAGGGSGGGAASWDEPRGVFVQQTLTLVLRALRQDHIQDQSAGRPEDWSLASLFGSLVTSACPLALSSAVYLELEHNLLAKAVSSQHRLDGEAEALKEEEGGVCGKEPASEGPWLKADHVENEAFVLLTPPDRWLEERPASDSHDRHHAGAVLAEYRLENLAAARPLNVGIAWKRRPLAWAAPPLAPFRVHSYVTGYGNERGGLAVELWADPEWRSGVERRRLQPEAPPLGSDDVDDGFADVLGFEEQGWRKVDEAELLVVDDRSTDATDVDGGIVVVLFLVVPWYLRLYFHSLVILVDNVNVALKDIAEDLHISPAEDRQAPAVLEARLRLPSLTSTVQLHIDFNKAFLWIDEHPPDASRGFDLPAAVVTFPDIPSSAGYEWDVENASALDYRPLLQTLLRAPPLRLYGETLLVSMPIPDFSMPYNVITLTCTVIAMFFGSLFNTLRHRPGEDEQLDGGEGSQGLSDEEVIHFNSRSLLLSLCAGVGR